MFAVIGMLGVENGTTNEVTREFDTLEGALDGIREIQRSAPWWKAITLVHAEDLGAVMAGASSMEACDDRWEHDGRRCEHLAGHTGTHQSGSVEWGTYVR